MEPNLPHDSPCSADKWDSPEAKAEVETLTEAATEPTVQLELNLIYDTDK